MKKTKHSTEYKIRMFQLRMRRLLKKQLTFKIQSHNRFKRRKRITKFWHDEFVPIFPMPRFHLIKCRSCKCLKKADIAKRLHCIDCYNNHRRRCEINPQWAIWSDRTAC